MPKLPSAASVSRSRPFVKLCSILGITPSARQVRNLRNKRGPIYWGYQNLLDHYTDKCKHRYDGESERCKRCDMARSCFTQTYKELFS